MSRPTYARKVIASHVCRTNEFLAKTFVGESEEGGEKGVCHFRFSATLLASAINCIAAFNVLNI